MAVQKTAIIFDLAHVLFIPQHTNFEFNPAYFTPIEQGIALLEQCAAQRADDGTQAHRLFVLSNLDSESLEILTSTFPDIFKLFEGVLISGMVNYKKPDPRIFNHLLTTYNLHASSSIFIDDRHENVRIAQTLGITGIVCDDYKKVASELKILGII